MIKYIGYGSLRTAVQPLNIRTRRGGRGVRLRKILAGAVSLAFILLTVSGCFRIKADELYSLPKPSREYLKLQEQLTAVLATGAEYAPPLSGPNRQSVQLKDINGDGSNEAIAFFRIAGDKPLQICIMEQIGAEYKIAGVIEGIGTAIERIVYSDLDGDGIYEFIVGWKMSATLLHMTVYSIKGGQHVLLAEDDYTQISVTDIDNDGHQDVIAIRLPTSEQPGRADMYSLRSDGEVDTSSALLSKGIESITSVLKGGLEDGSRALFVEGSSGSSLITDILAWRNENLYNITANVSSGVSEETLRTYKTYCTDINGDGVTEVPSPRLLLTSQADTKYYVIDWYKYDSFGRRTRVFTTYHDFSDDWYLIMPEAWRYNIAVSRDDSVAGERTLIFSYLTGADSDMIDFLKVYTLSGDNKEDRARLPDRFTLEVHGDTIYAAEILSGANGIAVSKAQIVNGFRLLSSDWATGIVS